VAGLYHQAMLARKAGRTAEAAQLIGQLAQRLPDDTSARLLAIESLIMDKQDGRAALAALASFPAVPDTRFLRFRVGILRADAFVAAGMPDSARIVLQSMAGEFAGNRAVEDRLAKLP
jgi:predicted Zn-dependent protease